MILPFSLLVAPLDASDKETNFAKYLTGQKLLQLQLNDSQFRRYILVQFLIIFRFLRSGSKFQ